MSCLETDLVVKDTGDKVERIRVLIRGKQNAIHTHKHNYPHTTEIRHGIILGRKWLNGKIISERVMKEGDSWLIEAEEDHDFALSIGCDYAEFVCIFDYRDLDGNVIDEPVDLFADIRSIVNKDPDADITIPLNIKEPYE